MLEFNKDKIKYNLDKMKEINYPYHTYSNCYGYMVAVIEKYNLEFNSFIDWLVKLNRQEGLYITQTTSSRFAFKEYEGYLNMQFEMYDKVKEKYPDNWLTSLAIMKSKFNKWKKLHEDERFLNKAEYYKT